MNPLMGSATAHTPLRELIVGLDVVAAKPIPYAQLPRRARTDYSTEFVRWSDIADQTVHSLLSRRRGAGRSTVSAVLAAAKDAVAKHQLATTGARVGARAAVQRLLDDLDDRDRAIVMDRVFTQRPLTQGDVAERHGMNKAWVHRHEPRSRTRLAEMLADQVHREILDHAEELSRRLGPYVPGDAVAAELRRLDVDPDGEIADVLLHLAGPYVQLGEWFENTATGGEQQAGDAIADVFAQCSAPTTEMLTHALAAIGMPAAVASNYIRTRAGWRSFGAVWVRWGNTSAAKAEAVLHVRGAPATADDIYAAIGPGPTTPKSVREAIYRDDRFARVSRQTWGLRAWGLNEYVGIAEEIGTCIDATGGKANIAELIHELLSRHPDVAEDSIKLTLNTLAFITEGDMVRRRRETDEWPAVAPLRAARGAFRNGHNEIRWATTATSEVLRGSGRPIHPAVATAIGVSPGQRRSFSSPHGELEVAWRLTSTNGPSVGSVRALAQNVGAVQDDTLVLVFRVDENSVDVTRIGVGVAGVARLRPLLGHVVRSPGAALAASLGCRRADEAAAVLRKRGDDDLADLIHE